MAHLWRSTLGSSGDSTTRTHALGFAIGARSRLPCFPDAYFGNAIYPVALAISESDLLKGELGTTALKINQLISQHSNEAIKCDAEKKLDFRSRPNAPSGIAPPLVISSSPHFRVYDCDFGWGKPVAIRSGKTYKVEGLVVVSSAAEPGGIDVEVCFAEDTLQAMEDYLTSH